MIRLIIVVNKVGSKLPATFTFHIMIRLITSKDLAEMLNKKLFIFHIMIRLITSIFLSRWFYVTSIYISYND